MAREQAIADLDRAVEMAVQFFESAEERLFDGNQSAREVISHLVFWHGEYVRIANALADGRAPRLITGKFRDFNAAAAQRSARQSLPQLARQLASLQRELNHALDRLGDWHADFPIKQGTQYCNVSKRVLQIRAHIAGHVTRLVRAARRKERRA